MLSTKQASIKYKMLARTSWLLVGYAFKNRPVTKGMGWFALVYAIAKCRLCVAATFERLQRVGNLLPTRFRVFRFTYPVRRRVAQAGQGISARTV
jgi:hypothetical protein